MIEISKKDWKLFREKIGGWQESYMEHLVQEYTELLSDPEVKASEKFWKLEKKIKNDKKSPGVLIHLSRSEMLFQLVDLMNDGAICFDDLDEFTDDIKDAVRLIAHLD